MKKFLSVLLAAFISVSAALTVIAASTENSETSGASVSFRTESALYAHAVAGSNDSEAWTAWQCSHNDELMDVDVNKKYFFLPSCSFSDGIELYNAGNESVAIAGTEIPPKDSKIVSVELDKSYSVDFNGQKLEVSFLRSTAEAAIYVNNSDADGNGKDLMTYLNADKSISAKATGAIVDKNGEIDNTPIKKIKGRGNTTWDKSKKPYNITYDSKVSVAGMTKSKKYSLLANYQDDSLSRNRFLYDLSDAVGLPYASDSRFVDFYVNGYYWGSYQMTQKIEVGSSNVVNDIEEDSYLNADGSVKEDFPFVCEVDPSAGSDDFTVNCSNNINLTIKSPDLSPSDTGYSEVKAYVKSKFNAFSYACANPDNRDLAKYGDIASLTKLYLINELGKNWDSGVSSLYFTYKQDADGNYKFFGSPVWDYDNSLGNAVGVKDDLNRFGVTDYTQYTGWWCRYKGKRSGSSSSTNIMNNLACNKYILNEAPKIWFEDFVPALRHFSGEKINEEIGSELYTRQEYFDIVSGSAEMNYRSGWLLNTGSWIADHSRLNTASFDYETGKYTTSETLRNYQQSFSGMYDYCADWLMSRAAWLSAQMYDDYTPAVTGRLIGDMNNDKRISSDDALFILRASMGLETISNELIPYADVNGDNAVKSNDALAILRYTVGLKDNSLRIGEVL